MIQGLRRLTAYFVLCMSCATAVWMPASAATLAEVTNQDAVAGLKEALTRGSQAAIQQLGKENGFFGNDRLRIPLPESLQKVESAMRRLGMGKQADDLILRMNRAAETAMPEARALLMGAVKQMSVQDAKGILTGGDDAATQYFKRTTSEPLAQKFLPIIRKATEKVQLAERYNAFAQTGTRFGLVREEDAQLENYITRKALDGLFLIIADEEKKIRADPIGSTSSIIKKVFGSMKF